MVEENSWWLRSVGIFWISLHGGGLRKAENPKGIMAWTWKILVFWTALYMTHAAQGQSFNQATGEEEFNKLLVNGSLLSSVLGRRSCKLPAGMEKKSVNENRVFSFAFRFDSHNEINISRKCSQYRDRINFSWPIYILEFMFCWVVFFGIASFVSCFPPWNFFSRTVFTIGHFHAVRRLYWAHFQYVNNIWRPLIMYVATLRGFSYAIWFRKPVVKWQVSFRRVPKYCRLKLQKEFI